MDDERMDRILELARKVVRLLEDRENRWMITSLMMLAELLGELHNEMNICELDKRMETLKAKTEVPHAQ